MNKIVASLIAFVAIIGIGIAVLAVSYISANDYGSAVESQLKAARDNNKNILAQYEQKILEAAQVPEMYKNDLKEVVLADVQGRYGASGSKANMQWFKERDLPFDSAMHKKMQQLIEAGRKDFEVGQTKMIDIRRGYEAQIGFFWRGLWLRIAGFPKINLDEYKPVTTDRTETSFTNGKESGPIKLR